MHRNFFFFPTAPHIQKTNIIRKHVIGRSAGLYACLSVRLSPILLSLACMVCFMMTYPLCLEGHLTFLNLNSHHRHTHHPRHLNQPHSSLSLQATKSTHNFLPPCFVLFTLYHMGCTNQLTDWSLTKIR